MDRSRGTADLIEILGDWAGPGPLYRALAGAVRRAVLVGDLVAGDRLPAERELARALRVSRATVAAAYDALRGAGVLDSRRGSGSRISAGRHGGAGADDLGRSGRAEGGGTAWGEGGTGWGEAHAGRVEGGTATALVQRLVSGSSGILSLASAVDPGAPAVAEELAAVAREDLPGLLADAGYHPHGLPRLREALAGHYRAAGLPTSPDQIVVTTGATQAISLATALYLRRGSPVVVESPSWPDCLDTFRAARARLVPVPLDGEGARVDRLAAAFGDRPALAYLMPTFHNPTGTLMSAARRRRIGELAARHGVPVLEDNAYSAPLDDAPPPAPLAAYAPADAAVLTVGSLTKSVWAGLRVGWVRAPTETAGRLARLKARTDLGSPVLDQALAARLLPRLPDLAAAGAARARLRLAHLEGLLRDRLPAWRWTPPDGGSALWVLLPDTDARVFAQVALRHGVEVVPGAATDPDGGHGSRIRIPFTLDPDVLTELAARLARAWADL
ncbi:GntR family transcriptional regulator [Longispora fulva]|uniref:DNA-binding transcriptional MocR family regulator n=1 Tax=Longispora fulva TaxID=619741 RepID=A0A8J7KXF1_9ACTN|nr:PLP-dependent aminotransferase family protein [Longispora fulva]MBG6137747.1 DNA-binding transcriptional MocR family regulator [Longispora fulva]GIG62096.1 GntR family transcriptional regulator [Longispora fulva]